MRYFITRRYYQTETTKYKYVRGGYYNDIDSLLLDLKIILSSNNLMSGDGIIIDLAEPRRKETVDEEKSDEEKKTR